MPVVVTKSIKSRLRILIAEKELLEGRKLGLRTIAKESGATVNSVQKLSNNTIKRVPIRDLALLCAYFDVTTVDEILSLENNYVT